MELNSCLAGNNPSRQSHHPEDMFEEEDEPGVLHFSGAEVAEPSLRCSSPIAAPAPLSNADLGSTQAENEQKFELVTLSSGWEQGYDVLLLVDVRQGIFQLILHVNCVVFVNCASLCHMIRSGKRKIWRFGHY